MKITNLSITNFLTIGRADLELDDRGLLLIQGVNLDDTSATSNGSGKSSIVDALCWCIYGTTARDASGDDVVNDTARKDCQVTVELDDAGVKYRIRRHRKHTFHKNQLYVWQINPTPPIELALHKGTERETQDVIGKIIGCSLEVFVGSIYAGQEQMPDLPGMTDKQLKLLVEEAAGVEELAEAYLVAQKDALNAEKAVAVAQADHANAVRNVDLAVASLTDAQDRFTDFEANRRDAAKAELIKALPLNKELAELQKVEACYNERTLREYKVELEAQIAGVKGEQAELERWQKIASAALTKAKLTKTAAIQARDTYTAAKKALAEVEDRVGSPCDECGKPYCEHDIADARTLATNKVNAIATILRAKAEEAKSTDADAVDAAQAVEDFKATMTDITTVSLELQKTNGDLNSLTHIVGQIKNTLTQVANIKANAQRKLTEPNPYAGRLEDYKGTVEDLTLAAAAAATKVETLQANAELLSDAAKVFGPAGVRAHILDTVTPFLNAQTGEYLGALADGNIHATWNTLSTNAKGELKEKFNIAVTNDKGGKTFKLQSGGEKRKARLATALALQDMVASRASKPIQLFLADEIDDALDGPGLERLMGVLEKKARERGTVLVISHNSLSDWCDQILTVTKSGGMSTVSGANVRGF